jgi:hypothetical protein
MLKGIDPLLTPDLLRCWPRWATTTRSSGRRQLHRRAAGRGKPVMRLPGVGMQRPCAPC